MRKLIEAMSASQCLHLPSQTFQVYVAIAVICILGHLSSPMIDVHRPIHVGNRSRALEDCLLVVMLSNIEDKESRAWHRQSFLDQTQNMTKKHTSQRSRSSFPVPLTSSTLVDIRFAVPLMDSALEVERLRLEESQTFHDIIELKRPELTEHDADGFPTETNFDAMNEAEALLNSWTSCEAKYFIRAETAYVINYKALAHATEALPSKSVYFGSMITKFPTPLLETRVAGSLSHSYLPVHAFGGFYGVSHDVLQLMTERTTVRTVVRKDIGYQVPWQDRALGLALFRSQVSLKNMFYLKGVYHLCSTTTLSCKDYTDFIAFKVAEEATSPGTTAQYKSIQDLLGCKGERSIDTKLVKIPDNRGKSLDSTLWPIVECAELSTEGQTFFQNVTREGAIASAELSEDTSCAEQFYILENPDVVPLIENGTYKSGREHYVDKGWKNFGKSYFCPDYCKGRKVSECLKDCDKERFYLEQYDDVREGVKLGWFPNGWTHFDAHGRKELRAWSCLRMHQPKSLGSLKGCKEVWTKFIDNTYPVVKTWSVWGEPNDLPPDQCKAVLLIDGRGGPWIEFMLRIFRHFVGPDWLFYLIGPPSLTGEWRKKFEGPMFEVVDIPEQFGNLSDYPRQVNELYMSQWLWSETIKCEYVVHTHADVMMFRPGIEEFLGYPYAGAPVSPETYIAPGWSRICTINTRCGGGGGFSIRRKSYTLKALKQCKVPWDKRHYCEDMWYSECMGWMGHSASMAHPVEANRMTLGDRCEVDNPIGIHHAWMFCKSSVCAYVIADSTLYRDIYGDDYLPKAPCLEGEYYYFHKYEDVLQGVPRNVSEYPAWDHYIRVGAREGRFYPCFDPVTPTIT